METDLIYICDKNTEIGSNRVSLINNEFFELLKIFNSNDFFIKICTFLFTFSRNNSKILISNKFHKNYNYILTLSSSGEGGIPPLPSFVCKTFISNQIFLKFFDFA